MNSKLTIGTAQLGLNYGTLKRRKKISIKEFKKIIKYCEKKKILSIDTAINYGNSEIKIGKVLSNFKSSFDITTKIPSLGKIKSKNISKKITDLVKLSSSKLNSNINTILLHDLNDLKSKRKFIIYNSLINLKKNKIVKNIGFSAYNFEDVRSVLKDFKFDIIQVPFNVFDQRLLSKNLLKFLKKNKIKIHIRSIFLQGILIDYNEKYSLVRKNFEAFNKWKKFLNFNKLNELEACIAFVKKYKFYSKVLIGFDNFNQLYKIIFYLNKHNIKNVNFNNLKSNNMNLINPIKWKKKIKI